MPDCYDGLHAGFGWQVPSHFNMAQVCCGRWAERPDARYRVAILTHREAQSPLRHSYAQLQDQAHRLSNALSMLGVGRGDRVAIVLPQRFETAVAYMAVLQMGAVAMPLSTLFGPEALEFRLHDSEAVLALCDAAGQDKLQSVGASCPMLRHVVAVDAPRAPHRVLDYATLLARQPAQFTAVPTGAEDPAILIYTSGTTGNPKGALIPHRALIGNLSGFICSQNWFGFDPQPQAPDAAR